MTTLTRPTARMIAAVALVLGVGLPVLVTIAFDERVDDVEARLDNRTDALRDRIDDVDASGTAGDTARAAALSDRLDLIEESLADIADRLEELTAAIDAVEAQTVAEEAAAVTATTTTRPTPRATPTTTAPPAQRIAATGGDDFAALAACESTGDHDGAEPHRIKPDAVNPTGKYRGAFQFDLPTWQSVGGTGDPAQHPYAEQLDRARALQARRGWAPWPRCSELLGLA